MPSSSTRSSSVITSLLFALLAALLAAGLAYMIAMPGRSHSGPLAAATDEEQALASRLRHHVEELAKRERNRDLERPASYIESTFASYGLAAQAHPFESGGRTVRNIEVVLGAPQSPAIVVGAHYDTVPGSPGANDNASGVAVLLELARLLSQRALPASRSIRLIAFANEEAPYFLGDEMGSYVWARHAKQQGLRIQAMLSLEMLGYYSDAPRSQKLPFPLGFFYPHRADFIAFVGDLGSRALVRRAIGAFRRHAAFPSEGVAAPSLIPGVTWSDHWSFRRHGFPAIMVTDTAFYRYPHYHLATDTPEKLDYERMARVAVGLSKTLEELMVP